MNILAVGQAKFGDTLKKKLAGLRAEVAAGQALEIHAQLRRQTYSLVYLDDDFFRQKPSQAELVLRHARKAGVPVIVISSNRHFSHILKNRELGAADYVIKPFNEREFIMRTNAVLQKKIRIVCIGGGTGLFTLLLGLKSLPNALLTSVVSMSDDGGSSGKLSQSLGLLPPGDIRRSLVALSNAPAIMNQIMQYRFKKKGELAGHSFGNIFLAALTGVKGTMSEAVRALSDILYLQGIVLPVSSTPTKLVARFSDGTVVKGESKIDRCEGRSPDLRLVGLRHEPAAKADPDAVASILFADFVTMGPGDLFTSIITSLIIKNIREAVKMTPARKIYICNLMTKPGETSRFDAAEHVSEIVKYLGADCLDFVLISNTKVSKRSVTEYMKKMQMPIYLKNKESVAKITSARVILADIGNANELVRHDSTHLKNEIQKIMRSAHA